MCCGWTARTRAAEIRRSTAPKRVGFLVLVGVGSDAQAWHWARVWLSGGLVRLSASANAPLCGLTPGLPWATGCVASTLGGRAAASPPQAPRAFRPGPAAPPWRVRRAHAYAYAAPGARRARHHEGSAPLQPSRRCSCTALVRRSAGGAARLCTGVQGMGRWRRCGSCLAHSGPCLRHAPPAA